MFGPQRHENLAGALPVPVGGSVVDLGCGKGPTLAALAVRLNPAARLVGVDADHPELADERVEVVVADLNEPLPFADEDFDAAVCQNVVECLRDPQAFLAEVARSALNVVQSFAWVGHHTTFEHGGPAHMAARLVAAEGRRDPELAARVYGWLADLEQQAQRRDLLYSINDFAVLLHKPIRGA